MMQTATIRVDGMNCEGCAGSVTRALQRVDGVDHVEVTLASQVAQVTFDPAKVGLPALVTAIKNAGYEVVA
jgi:copper chaperone CopZ